MTPDQPTSADLLRTAASVLKQELLPVLPTDKRLDALMILAIIGGAERELADAGGLQQRQAERLEKLLPHGGTAQELCDAIRIGKFDAPDEERVLRATLKEDVLDRLVLVNPRYLE